MSVKWQPPDQATLKINTDGAFSEATGKAAGGGLIRNHLGKMILAFATPLDTQSALEAELKAAHLGLALARNFMQTMWLELDSEQVIKLTNGTAWGPAHVRHDIARLRALKCHTNFRASFIHREGNMAADFLAKLGMERPEFCQFNDSTAPRLLKAMIRMEEIGVPNIRVRGDNHD
ncbi:uncharacterized protein LOC121754412 [Salvia splendens]|uniref:uncharacterized protein LOC121754412 n=1 Tax=Salvia splendens TaxID=180675 RepID=UPI001C25D597|nr:uncharacterized protein LOC121754412 [Salvia splendens]